MPAHFPALRWCVLCTLYIFQKEKLTALAFNQDMCSHLALCLHVMLLQSLQTNKKVLVQYKRTFFKETYQIKALKQL
jgi:hypothetical protein